MAQKRHAPVENVPLVRPTDKAAQSAKRSGRRRDPRVPMVQSVCRKISRIDRSLRMFGATILRTFRLQLLRLHSQNEEPKIAFRKSRTTAVLRALVHIPPLAGCLGLIILNSETYLYGGAHIWISLLQFVAKIHEVLMQASIAANVISLLRQELVNEGRIPFGGLFPALRISSLSSLWSMEFWSAASTATVSFGLSRKVLFVSLVPFCVLLANFVGPSSAIAMIPRPGNYPLGTASSTVYANESLLFPAHLSSETLSASNKGRDFTSLTHVLGRNNIAPNFTTPENSLLIEASCPADNLQTVLDQVSVVEWGYELSTTTSSQTSISLVFPLSTLYYQHNNFTTATTPHSLTVIMLQEGVPNGKSDWNAVQPLTNLQLNTTIIQPFVQVSCGWFSVSNHSSQLQRNIPFGAPGISSQYHSDWTFGRVVESHIFNPHGHFIWIPPEQRESHDVSTFIILVGNTMIADGSVGDVDNYITFGAACTVKAVWAASDIGVSEPLLSSAIQFEQTPFSEIGLSDKLEKAPAVSIAPSWGEIAAPLGTVVNSGTNLSLVDIFQKVNPTFDWGEHNSDSPFVSRFEPAEELVSGLLATSMAQLRDEIFLDNRTWCQQLSIPGSDFTYAGDMLLSGTCSKGDGYEINITLSVPGHVYNLDGLPIRLAISVLSIYCVFTIACTIYTIRTGVTSSCWILSLKSPRWL
ncbi:hypothetical protein H2200_003600 [Cladophialophora chaetospira]|uniref:Uncharacterized protein n=1 Tax=Cladophialophora chaetospira TaxID=386627 RepID=A0AA39CKV5_9EURO|nr:hypothetical protein H2200_003600 [Cladophialophora chaetospira]